MVVHACNPCTQEAEAGGQAVQGHNWLHSKFKTSLGYVRPCLKQQLQKSLCKYIFLLKSIHIYYHGYSFF